jgi:hypothetical protein
VAVTAAQWKKAVLPLLDEPARWAFKGKLAYRRDPGWLLLGIHAGGSGFSKDQVYIQSLYMPLYIPFPYLALSYGTRVPTGTSTFPLAELAEPVRLALSDVPDERAGLEAIAKTGRTEAACYALLLLGRRKQAVKKLDADYYPSDQRAFVEERRERMRLIRDLLRNDEDQAIRQLGVWREERLAALGIR